ncbi:MAG: DUF4129 domain-containing protein [Bacteroidetes Order II. Incertae sedis bacterium]|nr:DUF4129 domain-containing protein [Bacteroidetes Order II. bacterium]
MTTAQEAVLPDSVAWRTPDPMTLDRLKTDIPLPVVKPITPSPTFWTNLFDGINWILEQVFGSRGKQTFWKTVPIVFLFMLLIFLLWRATGMDRTGLFYGTGGPSGVGKMVGIASLSQINFEQEIRKAESQRHFREAVRWQYLQLLHRLEVQGLIVWKPDKTNADYVAEIRGTSVIRAFQEATRHFEYVWYGEYIPDEVDYRNIVETFDTLNKPNPQPA